MLKTLKNIQGLVRAFAQVKPNESVLIIADDNGSAIKVSQQVAETCTSEGAVVVLAVMPPLKWNGYEPPKSIAAAMLESDVIFTICAGPTPVHTNAAKAAREKGIRIATVKPQDEALFDQELLLDDLIKIGKITESTAELLSRSNSVRITSSLGTDLKMSLKGRKGLVLGPSPKAASINFVNSGEAAISPVEGSTEGILVSDGGFLGAGWDQPSGPVRLIIKSGKVTEVSGPDDYVKRIKEFLATDKNASNCAAELGIGTSPLVPRRSRGAIGTLHLGVGRNNDIGGETFSKIHSDLLIFYPSLWLDDLCLIKDGEPRANLT